MKLQELNVEELKNVNGGRIGLLSGGTDLSNVLVGTIGYSSNSSGMSDGHSYESHDDEQVNFGLGNMSSLLNF